MNAPVIKVEGLGKKYILQHEKTNRPVTFRETVSRSTREMVRGKSELLPGREEFWALKDINFEVGAGESVGIIGRNGAGKSTLLKILSRITEPTEGKATINGRVASLLEVGTGFHQELTGRENIFLNGAILGMSQAEIRRKFDEIVDFSGVEKFLDTPVKYYSSGMNVRLAFAIAAHLEPEILVVDEVLAVGDAEFQKKCLGKMSEVSKHDGRTVLFVSHDLGSIAQLCEKTVLLNEGRVTGFDTTEIIIKKYLESHSGGKGYSSPAPKSLNYIREMKLFNQSGQESYSYAHDEPVTIRFTIIIGKWAPGLFLAFAVQNRYNKRIGLDYVEIPREQAMKHNGISIMVNLPADFLTPGTFSFDVSVITPNIEAFDLLYGVCNFEVIDNNSRITRFSKADYGDVFLTTTHSFQD
ncbi:MAG: polysaccharide ABC transporter ATP-binding protein [Chitinophagaceae bacterium]